MSIIEFLGLILPVLTDIFNRRIENSDIRWLVSLGTAAIIGVFLNWLQTSFVFANPMAAFESITSSIMVVFGLSQVSYNVVWENSKVRKELTLNAKEQ